MKIAKKTLVVRVWTLDKGGKGGREGREREVGENDVGIQSKKTMSS